MVGKHSVEVIARKLIYRITVERNITILQGDSATGKTDMVRTILLSKRKDSPYKVNCDVECVAINFENADRVKTLDKYENSIVFIDEDVEFIKSHEFAKIVEKSTCYFVLVTREQLPSLPYSCRAINRLVGKRIESGDSVMEDSFRVMYDFNSKPKFDMRGRLSCVIVEDSNSGYDFFYAICKANGIDCISANGNSNIAETLRKRVSENDDTGILIIADGAAIGPYFDKLQASKAITTSVVLYLPESFEYLLLRSGLVCSSDDDRLINTYNYARSEKYMSWERYYTELIS